MAENRVKKPAKKKPKAIDTKRWAIVNSLNRLEEGTFRLRRDAVSELFTGERVQRVRVRIEAV